MARSYEKERQQEQDMSWLKAHLSNVQAQGFYGTFSIIFENGRVQRITKQESIMPPSRSDTKARKS